MDAEKKVGKRWSGPPHPGRTQSLVRLLKINKTHTEILQKHYLRRHINKTHTDILQKDTYRHPTDEAKHHLSNTRLGAFGPGADILDPRVPRASWQLVSPPPALRRYCSGYLILDHHFPDFLPLRTKNPRYENLSHF